LFKDSSLTDGFEGDKTTDTSNMKCYVREKYPAAAAIADGVAAGKCFNRKVRGSAVTIAAERATNRVINFYT